jgi:phage portal protein BeeE
VFWRQTVIPLVQRSVSAMSEWLTQAYGRTLELHPDIDGLDALAPDARSIAAVSVP